MKYWRLDFRIDKKYKTLGLGTFPEVSLLEARAKREHVRQILSQGIDPSAQRKAIKATNANQSVSTFEIIGREWLEPQTEHWVPSHAERNKRRLERYIFPLLGSHIALFELGNQKIMLKMAEPIFLDDGDEIIVIGWIQDNLFHGISYYNLSKKIAIKASPVWMLLLFIIPFFVVGLLTAIFGIGLIFLGVSLYRNT